MKTDLFQSCGHCWVFQICWHIECSTFTASSFRIWNNSTGIPSPPLALFVLMLAKGHFTLQDVWLYVSDHTLVIISVMKIFFVLFFCVFLPPCRGPALAGSSVTLRMNGIGEWEKDWDNAQGLSLKFLFALPLYTLNIFGGNAYCLHTGHLKTLQQLVLQQKQDVTHILSFTRVFLIIWPSGLLTFYGLHLVWLKQLQ